MEETKDALGWGACAGDRSGWPLTLQASSIKGTQEGKEGGKESPTNRKRFPKEEEMFAVKGELEEKVTSEHPLRRCDSSSIEQSMGEKRASERKGGIGRDREEIKQPVA